MNVIWRFTKNAIKLVYIKLKFGSKVSLSLTARIGKDSQFEGANKIEDDSLFSGNMGYGTYVSPYCEIVANIGRFTSIAPYVRINPGVHPFTYPYVTTCPMFFSTRRQNGRTFADRMMFDEMKQPVCIGSDCWIGQNVFISGGVNIGDGAVVLAGAVVTKDVEPYAVVGGVPAHFIKYRYDEETIRFLLDFKWWNKDISWIKENWELFNDVNQFISTLKNADM